jgi:hypothetical protein
MQALSKLRFCNAELYDNTSSTMAISENTMLHIVFTIQRSTHFSGVWQ